MHIIKEYIEIPIGNIQPHPDNPRKNLGDLTELAESLKVNGFISNLTVVPLGISLKNDFYVVIAGHRRLAAAKLAGINRAPCKVVQMSREEQLSMMLGENMQRNELTIKEQADGFQLMFDLGSSIEDIAQLSGFTTQTIKHRLAIAKLESKAVEKAIKNGYTLDDFAKLEKVKDIEMRNKLMNSNNHNTISHAIDTYLEDRKKAEYKQKLFAELAEHGAIELTNTDKVWQEYKMVVSFNISSLQKGAETFKIPETSEQLYYSNDYADWLYLRVKIDKNEKSAAEAERERKKAENDCRNAELDEVKNNLEIDYIHFLNMLDETPKNLLIAYRCFLAVACIGMYSYRPYIMLDKKMICGIVGIEEFPISETFVNGVSFPADILYELQKRPARFFFNLALECVEDGDIKLHTYNSTYNNNYTSRLTWIKHLILAGFNPTDEQKKYIEGTHKSYMQEEEK